MNELLEALHTDYLLVNSTNEYLVEYSSLSENARHTLTGFTGSTGDALISKDNIYLFVDGRYHTQAEIEAKKGVCVIKLQLGQTQDEEISKIIKPYKTFSIVGKKVSQLRFENFKALLKEKNIKIQLLSDDPINNYTEKHDGNMTKASYTPKKFVPDKPTFITNLEEVSYLTGMRDFSKDNSSKIWGKLFVNGKNPPLLFTSNKTATDFLKNYEGELVVDKASISAFDYAQISTPIHKKSDVNILKAIKTDEEIESYKKAFDCTDKTLCAIRDYIEKNDGLSEFSISEQLRKELKQYSMNYNALYRFILR